MYKQSKELLKKRLEKRVKKLFFFYLIPIFLFLAIIIFLFNFSKFGIKDINIAFNNQEINFLNEDDILKNINLILNERYFSILNKRNYIFFPRDEIKEELKEKFSSIKEINLEWNELFISINVDILEEELGFTYCKTIEDKKNCYSVNSDGKIFHRSEINEKNKKNIILISKLNFSEGDNFFNSKSEKDEILKLINSLKKNKNLETKYIVKDNKFFNILILKNNTKILLNSDFEKDDIYKKIDRILKEGDFKIKGQEFLENIDYINLTLKNRIPYCIRGEVCEGNY